MGWFRWVYDTFQILPGFIPGDTRVEGAVYKSDLLDYAAFQGSVEILRWLTEEKGYLRDNKRLVWANMTEMERASFAARRRWAF